MKNNLLNHIKQRNSLRGHLRHKLLVLLGLTALTLSSSAFAAVDCAISDSSPVMALQSTISVTDSYAGNDLPVGSEIYRAHIAKTAQQTIYCNGNFTLPNYLTISNQPMGAPKNMSTPYGTGPVYPTNVAGVGVVLWTAPSGTTNYIMLSSAQQPYSVFSTDTPQRRVTLNVSLIKTGPIASGATVDASSFPTVSWRVPATAGYTGLPIRLFTSTFTGSVRFISQSCTTPDLTVNMGSYDRDDNFKGVGSYTKWVDSSIQLKNCPKFTGYYGNAGIGQNILNPQGGEIISSTGSTSGGIRNANVMTVTLSPTTAVANDVIALTKSTDSATGIGLQLGYTPGNADATATSPQKIWSAGNTWDVTAPSDGRSTIKIPLAARYYQTDANVIPGKANAQVVFNIEYK